MSRYDLLPCLRDVPLLQAVAQAAHFLRPAGTWVDKLGIAQGLILDFSFGGRRTQYGREMTVEVTY